jgi:hypothetical protein
MITEEDYRRMKELYELTEEGFHSEESRLVSCRDYVINVTDSPDMLVVKAGHVVADCIKQKLSELHEKRKERRNQWFELKDKYVAQNENIS